MKFTMAKKFVAVVRYYETMYVISDDDGARVYTGTDEKKSKEILRTLNGYYNTKQYKAEKGRAIWEHRKRKTPAKPKARKRRSSRS